MDNPVTYGPLDFYDFYFEHKRQQTVAMEPAKEAIVEVGQEFGEQFGRPYGLLDPYRLDDAEVAVVPTTSASSPCPVPRNAATNSCTSATTTERT